MAVLSPRAAEAQFGVIRDDTPHARVYLATEFEALTPGPQELAAVFTIDPQWHLYWINPGDSGLPPSLALTLPDGITRAGPIRWPAPERYLHGEGELLDYTYEHEVTLLIPVTVDESLLGHEVSLTLDATCWCAGRSACPAKAPRGSVCGWRRRRARRPPRHARCAGRAGGSQSPRPRETWRSGGTG